MPDATYKVVGWFDDNHRFQARASVFEQPHSATLQNGVLDLDYNLGDPKADLTTFIVSIDTLETRTGIDFFPMLADNIENIIESPVPEDLWGAE